MRNLILLAVQGAGKGTLAKKLSEKYGYIHISTGDILRDRAKVDDELGRTIKNMIDNGIFVPDDIIFKAIEEKISSKECENGYILDGFPRNLEQALGYSELLKRLNREEDIVINMTIPEDLLVQRITGRRMCKDCGSIYNIFSESLKPLKDGICNKCGGSLYQRDDDNIDVMKTRVDTYFKVTAPVIDYYKDKNVLYEVPSIDLEETLKAVEAIISSLGDKID